MSTNKPNSSKKELAPKKIQHTNELNATEDVNMQDGDGISIYWGDEWNIEEGEKKQKK
ncbi:hypothetical protein [Bacillus sp. XF8]|uniref:Uncharacterized protein n=1 Tax=Bacillus bingmayongensis TaxID=1150157 RepID=A0ABU5JXL1_9BACI|nr:hypothetical protein [Bacillus sp. XF8]MBO1582397.1 hypothetical protein [Bacillus sp. XF8]MDZ5608179.1 hypothetical protein [Bacillus pseudomycoides]